jgi:hypothetical protein
MHDYDRSNYRYRIAWTDGWCVLQRRYHANGVAWHTVRIATDDDRAAMVDGTIGYDPETKPSTVAFARHVANGGD